MEGDKEKPTPSKISTGTWMILVGIAVFFDVLEAGISLIPFLGEIIAEGIDVFAFATFWLIFKTHGEKYSKGTMLTGAIIGFIPIINMLPECTVTIVKLYFDAKKKNTLAKMSGANNVTRMTPKDARATERDTNELEKAA